VLRSQLGGGAADVAQILPEVRELFPDLAVPSSDDEGARFRLFDSMTRFLRNAAAARPLVLVLDDLHAADEPSLLLLRFVAGGLATARILVVGTYRDVDPTVRDPLASTLAELAREPVTQRIELSGLAETDVGRYIELSTDTMPATELVSALQNETEGNPLFLGEIVRLLAAEGRLSDVDIRAMWTLGIPQGVREVIGRRLRRLSDESTQVLALASVLGREFGLDSLASFSEHPEDELLGVFDEALEARLLTSVPGARGRLRFAHALIRETLYERLTTPRRVQLHRRAGEALERLYAANPEPHLAELAYHFFEAAPGGDVDKAVAYAIRASEQALTVLAYEEAARFCDLALESLDLKEPPDPALHCELLLGLGEAQARAGNTPEAKETFVAAAETARDSGLAEHLARAAIGYGGRFVFGREGNDARLVPLLEEGLSALGTDDSVLRVRLLARLAGAMRDRPSLETRSSLSREAVSMARRLGSRDDLVYGLISMGWATWEPDPEQIPAVTKELRTLAQESGDLEQAVQAAWLEYVLFMTKGDIAGVTAWIDEYRPLWEKLKQPSAQWYGAVTHCALALLQGDFAEAEQLMEEASRLGERAQSWDAGFSYRIALFLLRREQGRLAEIEDLVTRSVDEYAGYRSFRCLVPLLHCELGRMEDARASFDALAAGDFSVFPRDIEWVFCLSVLAEVAAYLRDADRAASLHSLLRPYAELNAVAAGEVAIGSVARYLGLLASTLSTWDDAERNFEDALRRNERMGARPWVAHTKEDYARMLFARNRDIAKGEQLLDEALAAYRELGMTGPLERARAASPA
jgi:tetratricopeptide (TPR) repeat protein